DACSALKVAWMEAEPQLTPLRLGLHPRDFERGAGILGGGPGRFGCAARLLRLRREVRDALVAGEDRITLVLDLPFGHPQRVDPGLPVRDPRPCLRRLGFDLAHGLAAATGLIHKRLPLPVGE